jgi:D-tagatose-1,6-bisphosphate aldolase subunit GatZ/KbaZ
MQKNLTKYKMGYGPMSREIIDILGNYSEQYPLMVIASRNQVDYKNAYVCDQYYLQEKLGDRENILLCRDHCGPYFADSDKHLNVFDAIQESKKTIKEDLNAGFDLIHIDVAKVEGSLDIAEELIEFTLSLDSDIILEFGSEENTGQNLDDTLKNLDSQLEFCQRYKDNIKFFVAQSGSFTREQQLGTFDIEYNRQISSKIHQAGFLFKEHNGDYLTADQVSLRKQAGIDAINVAPQLGVVQTNLLYEIAGQTDEWHDFVLDVYQGNRYQRWLNPNQYQDRLAAALVSGHYFFASQSYKRLLSSINETRFIQRLENEIGQVLDVYRGF